MLMYTASIVTPSSRRIPDVISSERRSFFHLNCRRKNSVDVTKLTSQMTAIIALTRRSVKSILCFMGNRTARSLSAVIIKRFVMEKFIENLKMPAKFSPTSHGMVLYVVTSTILNVATAKPTIKSDTARLSSNLSNVFFRLQRNISTISIVFRRTIIIASIPKRIFATVEVDCIVLLIFSTNGL